MTTFRLATRGRRRADPLDPARQRHAHLGRDDDRARAVVLRGQESVRSRLGGHRGGIERGGRHVHGGRSAGARERPAGAARLSRRTARQSRPSPPHPPSARRLRVDSTAGAESPARCRGGSPSSPPRTRARETTARSRRARPSRVSPAGRLRHVRLPTARGKRRGLWRRAGEAELAAHARVPQCAGARGFSSRRCCDEAIVQRIGLDRFFVHEQDSALRGIAALWDQRAFKQIVARRYRAPIGAWCPAYNVYAKLFRRIPLPARRAGARADVHRLSGARGRGAAAGPRASCRICCRTARRRWRASGCMRHIHCSAALRQLKPMRYPARIYAVELRRAPGPRRVVPRSPRRRCCEADAHSPQSRRLPLVGCDAAAGHGNSRGALGRMGHRFLRREGGGVAGGRSAGSSRAQRRDLHRAARLCGGRCATARAACRS